MKFYASALVLLASATSTTRVWGHDSLRASTNDSSIPVVSADVKNSEIGGVSPALKVKVPLLLLNGAVQAAAPAVSSSGTATSVDIIIGYGWTSNDDKKNQQLVPNGDGTYTSHSLPGTDESTLSIAIADVNNDGIEDVITGNRDSKSNQVLIGDGVGGFTAQYLPGPIWKTNSIAVADVNGDGFVDIIGGNDVNHRSQLWINDGQGGFTTAQILSYDDYLWKTTSVTAADVNGDDRMDIIIGNAGTENYLLIGRGDGTFNTPQALPCGNQYTESIAVADVNGDNKPDLIIGNAGKNQYSINNGEASCFTTCQSLPGVDAVTTSVIAADVNKDGKMDIIIGGQSKNFVLINSGGTFNDAIELPGGSPVTTSIAVADMNGDTHLDIVVGNQNGADQLIFNKGDGTFTDYEDLPGTNAWSTTSIGLIKVTTTTCSVQDDRCGYFYGGIDCCERLYCSSSSKCEQKKEQDEACFLKKECLSGKCGFRRGSLKCKPLRTTSAVSAKVLITL